MARGHFRSSSFQRKVTDPCLVIDICIVAGNSVGRGDSTEKGKFDATDIRSPGNTQIPIVTITVHSKYLITENSFI